MEHTLFRSFCMANNLRSLVETPLLLEVLQELTPLLEESFTGDSRNPATTLADLGLAADEAVIPDISQSTPLPSTIYRALLSLLSRDAHLAEGIIYRSYDSLADASTPILSPRAQTMSAVMHRGRRYTTMADNLGDSQVAYRRAHGSTVPSYGHIQSIFVHERYVNGQGMRLQVFAAVRAYASLPDTTDAGVDPYREYRGIGARLVYHQLETVVEVIPMQYIISHYVACPYGSASSSAESTARAPYLVVMSLDAVRLIPPSSATWTLNISVMQGWNY